MSLIEVRDIEKTYLTGKTVVTPALRGVSLDIAAGEFTAIVGPSGSGKSSLLHIIGGLDSPTNGRVIYAGKDLSRISADELSIFRLQKVGFIFQAYNLINTLTAFENVEYVMLLQSVPDNERRKRAKKILQRVGLAEYLDRFPNEMSGGQQQRVAVARAMAAAPELVIADEPTANLDSKTAEALILLMRELNEENGVTFIFSTHDKTIMDQARRLVLLKDGLVVEGVR